MENNELKTYNEGTFTYQYTPAQLEINNYEEIKETISNIAETYEGRVYQDDDLPTILDDHKMLNSLRTGIVEGTRNVKKEVMKPFTDSFKPNTDKLIELIDSVLIPIKDSRDKILNAQEEARSEALQDYLERQLVGKLVRVEDLEIASSWTNKGNWTDKFNPRKALKDEVDREIKQVEEVKKNEIAQREILEKFLEGKGMQPEGWLDQLGHRSATDIMDSILKAEEKQKEAERIAEAEKASVEAAAQETTEAPQQDLNINDVPHADNMTYHAPTSVAIDTHAKITNVIEVTATVEQLQGLNDYMVANGIEVRAYDPELSFNETLDDLPF